MRGVREGGYHWNTTIGAEQRLIGLKAKVREAWGFQIEVVGHFASPAELKDVERGDRCCSEADYEWINGIHL